MIRTTIDVEELREHTEEVLREVQESAGEITITVGGQPVATLRGLKEDASESERSVGVNHLVNEIREIAEEIGRTTSHRSDTVVDTLSRMRDERQGAVSGLDDHGRHRR